MNRAMRRASEAEGRRRQKLHWDDFKDVTRESYERQRLLRPGASWRPDRVWQNNKYIVQEVNGAERDNKFYKKILIRRSDSQPIYSWQDLFRIKNEIYGDEVEAVQFFPKKSELTDDANLYWIWIEEDE